MLLRFFSSVLGVAGAIAVCAIAIAPIETVAAPASRPASRSAKVYSADIGWSKEVVKKTNGDPDRKSKDGRTWYYGTGNRVFVVHFNAQWKVDQFPGAKG